jgi:hypothetical protein
MPLRDHFHPPLDSFTSWEGFHAQWPAVIVQQLRRQLPAGYVASPRVHIGPSVEVDFATFKMDSSSKSGSSHQQNGTDPVSQWEPESPALAVATTIDEHAEYSVQIYDTERGRQLVAAIEIVSPANKDRPESRRVFVGKCAALLQAGVAVSIIDLVTNRHFNLYRDLLEMIGHQDSTMSPNANLYATSCRVFNQNGKMILQAWSHVLTVGKALPTLPLWLRGDLAIPLDLEKSYEQACEDLWIA